MNQRSQVAEVAEHIASEVRTLADELVPLQQRVASAAAIAADVDGHEGGVQKGLEYLEGILRRFKELELELTEATEVFRQHAATLAQAREAVERRLPDSF